MNQNRRIRAHSAKPFSQRQRPLSGKSTQAAYKTGMIQKIYTNMLNIQERPTTGRQKAKINSFHLANNISKIPGNTIQRQALQEQNLQLKKKVHLLEEELAKLNGRMESYKLKMSKANGSLNVEFQNQNLWTNKNAYLVTGVKNQYQNLKAKYKQKCDELNSLKSVNIYTNLKQLQKENEFLKKQNNKLLSNIFQLESKNSIVQNSSEIFRGQQGKVSEMMLNELEYKLASMEEKLSKRNKQLSGLRQNIQLQHTKTNFLEKLIIEKDNSLHALHQKTKRLEKEKLILVNEIDQISMKISQIQAQYEEKIQNVKENQEKKNIIERQIYDKNIRQKNSHIQKLQKEVGYLTTLLSYWKPLDEEKHPSSSPQKKTNQISNQDRYEEQKGKTPKVSEVLNKNASIAAQKSTESIPQRKLTEEITIAGPRAQKRADKKRSEQTKKVRRVKDSEVQETGELIKFRLIAQRIPIEKAKSYFNYVENPKHSQEQQAWQKEYISMKQTQNILKNSPFNLTEDQGFLLARYMVEDVMNDYIYCDEENQNKRDIVKSILKNVVGEYHVDKEPEAIENETKVELGKYRSKISTILEQMYPGGLITKRKLIEIVTGSGLEIEEDVMDYMIGKMAIKSQTLNNLDYRVLFSSSISD